MKKSHVIKIGLMALTVLLSVPALADTVAVTNGNMSQTSMGTIGDNTITTNVKAKMDQDPTLKGSNITVTSQQGVVTLKGNVDSQVTANTAIAAAKSVPGVKSVISNLSVNGSASNTSGSATSGSTSNSTGSSTDMSY